MRIFSDGYSSIFRRTWHFRRFSGDIKEAYLVTCFLIRLHANAECWWWFDLIGRFHMCHLDFWPISLVSTRDPLVEWDFLTLNRLCGTWKLPSVECNQKLLDIFYSHLTLFSLNWSEFSTSRLEIIMYGFYFSLCFGWVKK